MDKDIGIFSELENNFKYKDIYKNCNNQNLEEKKYKPLSELNEPKVILKIIQNNKGKQVKEKKKNARNKSNSKYNKDKIKNNLIDNKKRKRAETPVKYIPTGNGRETYIINAGGMYHDQKPLASYKLDDFLRGQNMAAKSPKFDSKKHYLSVSEKKYNNKLQTLEKQLINRLYKLPMRNKKIVNRNIILEDDKMLPSLDTKNGSMSNNHIHYASDSNLFNKGDINQSNFSAEIDIIEYTSLSPNLHKWFYDDAQGIEALVRQHR